MVLPVDRLLLQVAQGVVHPAHVPLQAEAEPAAGGRLRDARPRGRLLGDRHDAGHALVGRRVGLLEQADGLEVLAAAVDVGDPLAVLARVVEVEHRGDGVDAQAVDVELLEPVDRVGDEEVAHLEPAEVEDVGAPVGLVAAPGVRVLVEGQAVEAREGERVAREVARHPVEDDADAGLVEGVDEVLEVVGGAEAGRRGVVAGDLVAPRGAVGVLHDREELDVGEAEVGDVVDEVLGEVAVGHALAPRAEVHLVDAHRARVRVARRGARPSTRCPPTRGPTRRRPSRCSAGSRCGGPSGRPWCARRRRHRGSRTCRRVPTPTSGTKSSHTPDEPIIRIGWIRPSQSLKSPMTRTALARGAHTANETPRTEPIGPLYSRIRAPSTVHSCSCRPSPTRWRSTSPRVGAKR